MIELPIAETELIAFVDDDGAEFTGFRWRVDKHGYVYRKVHGKCLYLHHLILPGDKYPEFVRDHINLNKLDNRAFNLRWLTRKESAQNRGAMRRKHHLGLRGVCPVRDRFRATVTLNGIVHRLGTFDSADQAAEAAARWRAVNMPYSMEGGGS